MSVTNKIPKSLTKTSLVSLKQFASTLFFTKGDELKVNRDLPNQGVKVIDASAGGEASHEIFYQESIPTSRFMYGLQELVDPRGLFAFPFPRAENVKDVVQKKLVLKRMIR